MLRALVLVIIAASLSGCLYRPDLQQGDHLSQVELDELRPEFTKHQVQQIMGTPALTPVFELDHWTYTYAYLDGKHRDKKLQYKTIILHFNNGKLNSYSSQDWHPAHLPKSKN